MTDYKATPKQWTQTEQWAAMGGGQEACILELRARVEVLEANAKPTSNDRRIKSSLVHQVAVAIDPSICPNPDLYSDQARAAIREVAAWLAENAGGTRAAWLLEREVE